MELYIIIHKTFFPGRSRRWIAFKAFLFILYLNVNEIFKIRKIHRQTQTYKHII